MRFLVLNHIISFVICIIYVVFCDMLRVNFVNTTTKPFSPVRCTGENTRWSLSVH